MSPEAVIDLLVKVITALCAVIGALAGYYVFWIRGDIKEAKQATREAETRVSGSIKDVENRINASIRSIEEKAESRYQFHIEQSINQEKKGGH